MVAFFYFFYFFLFFYILFFLFLFFLSFFSFGGSITRAIIGRNNSCAVYKNRLFISGWTAGQLGVYDPQLNTWQTLSHETITRLCNTKLDYQLVATMDHGLVLITNDLQQVYSFTDIECNGGASNIKITQLDDWIVPRMMLKPDGFSHRRVNSLIMSTMGNSVIVCFVAIRRDQVHDMLWMDTLLAPGIWHNGPILPSRPVSTLNIGA